MATPAEDAAYQQALTGYKNWCSSAGQMPDPNYLDWLAYDYNQLPPGMEPQGPRPGTGGAAPAVPGGGTPAIPGSAAPQQPTGQAPGSWDALRGMFPAMPDDQWQALVDAAESMGLDYQTGFAWVELAVNSGVSVYIADLQYEVGMANAEASQIANDIAAAQQAANEAYQQGLLEEMRLSREQEAVLARELNALNQYIAEMQNQVSTLALQIQDRAYGAQLGAHPINTVEFQHWLRAGGSVEPVEIPEAPVPQPPEVPTAPAVPGAQGGLSIYSPNKGRVSVGAAPQNKVARPGELHTTGEEGWEYLSPGPGTVVAPRAQGEARPTQAGGQRAIGRQLSGVNLYKPPSAGRAQSRQAPQGKRVPYGWMKRRQALGFQGESVPSMQGGGQVPTGGVMTDEEMAAWLESAIQGWPALYNPALGGEGQFGAQIPSPGEMSRRTYYSMMPEERDLLTSFLEGGLKMPSGEMGPGIAQGWLQQMQRSWIPGLQGAKKSVQYAY